MEVGVHISWRKCLWEIKENWHGEPSDLLQVWPCERRGERKEKLVGGASDHDAALRKSQSHRWGSPEKRLPIRGVHVRQKCLGSFPLAVLRNCLGARWPQLECCSGSWRCSHSGLSAAYTPHSRFSLREIWACSSVTTVVGNITLTF